jgi:Fic family protein
MKKFQAGVYIRQTSYSSFQPNPVNRSWQIDDPEIINLLGKADRLLGTLNAYARLLPQMELYQGMHILKEATLSSRIEGTETNMQEGLVPKENVQPGRVQDWIEVHNYSKALHYAIDQLNALPISTRLIQSAHQILMEGVRGQHKQPGEYRRSQNWIGGATLADAIYVPPAHTAIPELMSDLEQFIHRDDIMIPELIRIAIVHFQFETIHPFLDGNGRIGRLLIPLYLVEKKLLERPILYLSEFLEKNRMLYYDNLTRVRESNVIRQWFRFFLVGIIETATDGLQTLDRIKSLHDEIDQQLYSLKTRAEPGKKVMEYLWQHPMIDAAKVVELTGLTYATAYRLIRDLEQLRILEEITGAKRGRTYLFRRYFEFFN